MASGEAAAKAMIEARKKGDYSAESLSFYQKLLNESFVMKDLKRYRKLNRFAEANPEFFDGYFDAMTQMAVDYFTVNELPKRQQEFRMLGRFLLNLSNHRTETSGKNPNIMTQAFSMMSSLIGFLWKCLKGGIAFI
jgi:flavin-dependent dehydrogenase